MLPACRKPAAGEQPGPQWELADIFRQYGEAYHRTHALPLAHLKVMHAIEVCRTAALGGHIEQCNRCGFQRQAYNSCLMGSASLWGVRRLNGARSMGCTRIQLPIKIWPTGLQERD